MPTGMTRQTEQIIGIVFLVLMILFVILAVTTFDGTPTVILLISALLFLGVGLFMMAGGGAGSGGDGGQSQQQSVVLSDGQVITQGGQSSHCSGCGRRVPANARFCPDCGHAMGS
jgi:hypothetical protein